MSYPGFDSPFLGQILLVPFSFVPDGFVACYGRLLFHQRAPDTLLAHRDTVRRKSAGHRRGVRAAGLQRCSGRLLDVVRHARGLDSVWVTDHVIVPRDAGVIYRYDMLDPLGRPWRAAWRHSRARRSDQR
jgi:hypothetical protein